MIRAKFIFPAAILAAGLMMTSVQSYGKADYTKKEKKGCAFCHVKQGSKELNEAGKYYKDHDHSLDGFKG